MKILILSRSKFLYSTKRLVTEAEKKGFSVEVVNPSDCDVFLISGNSAVKVFKKELNDIDVVLPRIGMTSVEYALTILHQFETANTLVLNKCIDIALAKDKFRSLQKLTQGGLPVPATVIFKTRDDINQVVDSLGGFPVVLKTMQGSQGVGVALVESMPGLRSMLETYWVVGQSPLVQKYYPESEGRDIRVFVIGGKAIAAMRRSSIEDDFRSNIHRGGIGEKIEITKELEELAVSSATVLNLDIAGVDVVETSEGYKVLEVNASPGYEGIEKVTNLNIAENILALAEKKLQDMSVMGGKSTTEELIKTK